MNRKEFTEGEAIEEEGEELLGEAMIRMLTYSLANEIQATCWGKQCANTAELSLQST